MAMRSRVYKSKEFDSAPERLVMPSRAAELTPNSRYRFGATPNCRLTCSRMGFDAAGAVSSVGIVNLVVICLLAADFACIRHDEK
jgi:hypothetical protein